MLELEYTLVEHALYDHDRHIGLHHSVHLQSAYSHPKWYLDGDVFARAANVVSERKAKMPRFCGVNWQLRPNENGTWTIINQHQPAYCLAQSQGKAILQPDNVDFDMSGTNWLIYRKQHTNLYCLRPQGGAWLSLISRKAGFAKFPAPDDMRGHWTITIAG